MSAHPAPLRLRQPTLCSSIFPPLLFRPSLGWREFWRAGPAPPTSPLHFLPLAGVGFGCPAGGSLLTSGAAGMPDGPIHQTGGDGGGDGRGWGGWSALLSTLLGALLSKQWLKEREGEECFQLSLQETTSKWGKNIKTIKNKPWDWTSAPDSETAAHSFQ